MEGVRHGCGRVRKEVPCQMFPKIHRYYCRLIKKNCYRWVPSSTLLNKMTTINKKQIITGLKV